MSYLVLSHPALVSSKFLRMKLIISSLSDHDLSVHELECHFRYFLNFTLEGIYSFVKHILKCLIYTHTLG